MQIKTAMRCYLIPRPRWQKPLSLTLPCLGESVQQEEAFHTADGSVKWSTTLGRIWQELIQLRIHITHNKLVGMPLRRSPKGQKEMHVWMFTATLKRKPRNPEAPSTLTNMEKLKNTLRSNLELYSMDSILPNSQNEWTRFVGIIKNWTYWYAYKENCSKIN